MIGQIHGIVILVNTYEGSVCIITQSGVGYTVSVGGNCACAMHCGCEAELFIETVVKEDSITLYGFESYEKQVWFKSLLKVSGVGTKMAIGIIDTFPIQDIVYAIANQSASFFQQVSGLGEKVSQRVISELKKEPAKNAKILGGIRYGNGSVQFKEQVAGESVPSVKLTKKSKALMPEKVQSGINVQDVISALVNLGFDYNKAYNAASYAVQTEENLENAIVCALKKIGSE